jgi:methionyl-tRNA formyltransferase
MASISLNATTFYPADIEETREKIGTEIAAANGARRFAHRAEKRSWTLTWNRVTAAVRTQIRAVHVLTTTFTYIDEAGTSFTVLCLPGAYRSSIGLIGMPGGVLTLYYNVTLTIHEA